MCGVGLSCEAAEMSVISYWPIVSSLNSVKDLALGLRHILCEILPALRFVRMTFSRRKGTLDNSYFIF